MIENRKLFNHKKTISLADRGNFIAYTQAKDFYIAARVKALELYEEKDQYILQYLTVSINNQKIRFSYGYNATNKVEDIKFLLPIDKNANPNWEYMRAFIQKIEKEKISKIIDYLNK